MARPGRLTALFLWTLQSTNGEGKSKKVKGKSEGVEETDEEDTPRNQSKGYSLVFDMARRFAQPLGIDLPKWEGRMRLMAVSERAKQLFGEDAVADLIEHDARSDYQQLLFPELEEVKSNKAKGKRQKGIFTSDFSLLTSRKREATTLDRVHAAMLLQSGGQANALRALIKAEQDRGPDFLRLANALSALYPKDSEEKRLLDAMLLAVPR